MRLIDPTDRYTMVAIDPECLRELITPILDDAYPGWSTEEDHDNHAYHDEPSMHSTCLHCRIYRTMNGNGWIVAAAQVALSTLRDRDIPGNLADLDAEDDETGYPCGPESSWPQRTVTES